MKYRTGQERRVRKEMKMMGKWPTKKPSKPLFASEKVLADASMEVQDLLVNAMSAKKSRQMILSQVREKKAYTKLSDAKTKTKSILIHPLSKKTKTKSPRRRYR